MKFNKTFFGVVTFVIILILAGYSARANADDDNGFRIGVGKTIVNSDLKIGEIGYEYNDWEINAALSKAGSTKRGYQDQVEIYSVSYLTKPAWGYKGVDPYFRIGLSYNDNSNLVGDTNYRLGVGINFHKVFRVEFSHHSSAGIHDPNTGFDYVSITYKIPPIF